MTDKTTTGELTEEEFMIAELAARTAGGVIEGLARHGFRPDLPAGVAGAAESVVAAFLASKAQLIAARS